MDAIITAQIFSIIILVIAIAVLIWLNYQSQKFWKQYEDITKDDEQE